MENEIIVTQRNFLKEEGNRLRAAREKKGLEIDAAATAAGITAEDLKRYEAGEEFALPSVMSRILNLYGTAAAYIIFGAGPQAAPDRKWEGKGNDR